MKRRRSRSRCGRWLLLVWAAWLPFTLHAAAPGDEAARAAALARAQAAVVGVSAIAVDDASSIDTLGRLRQGSGVVIGDDGLVLTIGYLILEADRVDLLLPGGRAVPARVVAYDLATGFGLIQALTPLEAAPAPMARAGRLEPDEPLLIGSGGEDGAWSLARLVSQRAFSGYWEYHLDMALFTAPQRPDHSGAGLFDADGELVGIGSLAVNNALGPDGPPLRGNMFVPVELLKPILGELRERGLSHHSTRAWLGLNCVEVGGTVRVVRLAPDGPADEAGVLPGDRILSIDGTPVDDLASLYKTLWRGPAPQRDVGLVIERQGAPLRITVHAVDRMSTLRKPQGI